MIVFDASTLVSAVFRRDSSPNQAVRHALRTDQVAVSEAVITELLDVLQRPRLARFVDPEQRAELIGQILALGAVFSPSIRIKDCRDTKDNKYLELALAASATVIVTSDNDLLVLHPWRTVRIIRPADYLRDVGEKQT